ncbi:MAG: elongation factor P maturation arginine rhamnosyltransferase EarP [Quisquiliibacterium sp.]
MLSFQIYCKVIDNLGDAGVAWRLARELAGAHRLAVSLFIDQPETLASIVPGARAGLTLQGVSIAGWEGANAPTEAGTIIVSAFGCELPKKTRSALAARPDILWINLEYLSAENWVDECHGLASRKPADDAIEYFFFPGFSQASGGLLRERDLLAQRDKFLADRSSRTWLATQGISPPAGERLISLFCYADAPVQEWLALLAESPLPTRVLVADGIASEAIRGFCGTSLRAGQRIERGALSVQCHALLAQPQFDHLLWSCELNFVRGEDSWVRAIWAGRPFIWQPYRQPDGAHQAKLQAFLARLCEPAGLAPAGPAQSQAGTSANGRAARSVAAMMRAWSGEEDLRHSWQAYEANLAQIARLHRGLTDAQCTQADLCSRLLDFCRDHLAARPG